jgi:hypothetical protein
MVTGSFLNNVGPRAIFCFSKFPASNSFLGTFSDAVTRVLLFINLKCLKAESSS